MRRTSRLLIGVSLLILCAANLTESQYSRPDDQKELLRKLGISLEEPAETLEPGEVRREIVFPVGADETHCLALLARGCGAVVVAANPIDHRELRQELKGTYPGVMRRLGPELDCGAVARRGSIALQRRYRVSHAVLEQEREELRRAAEDLRVLVQRIGPLVDPTAYTPLQDTFVAGLNPEQKRRMQSTSGLLFQSLSPQQQRAWLKISEYREYHSLLERVDLIQRALSRWRGASLARIAAPNGGTIYAYAFPEPKSPRGSARITVPASASSSPNQPGVASAFTIRSTVPAPAFQTLSVDVHVPIEPGRLEELIRAVERDSGARIRIPSYARGRRVQVAPSVVKANTLLQALEDLYGWRLTYDRGRSFVLDRPWILPAQNASDLYRRLRTVIPPALGQYLFDSGGAHSGWEEEGLKELVDNANKLVGPGWEGVPVTRFTPEQQDRIAQIFTLRALLRAGPTWLGADPLPPWLVNPEQGVFFLEMPPVPGANTFLWYRYFKPDGSRQSWGWAPGTSKVVP